MKVLIINFEYPPLGGGGGIATKEFSEELAGRHTIHVLTSRYKDLPADEEKNGVSIHRVWTIGRTKLPTATLLSLLTFVPAACVRGWQLCRQCSFDVINAQFVLPSGLPAALLARVFSIPLVISFIGGDVYDPSKPSSPHRFWPLRQLVRILSRQAVAGTAISHDTKRRVTELHGVTLPITVTPLGFTPKAVPPISRSELGLPNNVPVGISIGRLIPRKGYGCLLAAWRNVPDAHLVIIGDGPLLDQLTRYAKQHGLDERVHMLGFVPEVRKQQILGKADLYISAARHEGFGIVFLEAMAAGLPIVSFADGGQTDFLIDGHNAVLVQEVTDEALSAATNKLLADAALREHFRTTNQAAVKNFTIKKTTVAFEKVLEEAVQTRTL